MDGSGKEYLPFVRALRVSACLGYSLGHDEAIQPGTDEASVFREWSQSPSLPGLLMTEMCAVSYMMLVAENGSALSMEALGEEDLESFVFSSKLYAQVASARISSRGRQRYPG